MMYNEYNLWYNNKQWVMAWWRGRSCAKLRKRFFLAIFVSWPLYTCVNCIIQTCGIYTRPCRSELPIKPKIPLIFHRRRLRGMTHGLVASTDGVPAYNILYSHSWYHCYYNMLCVLCVHHVISYHMDINGTLRFI